jgi:hypothetical protein
MSHAEVAALASITRGQLLIMALSIQYGSRWTVALSVWFMRRKRRYPYAAARLDAAGIAGVARIAVSSYPNEVCTTIVDFGAVL